MDKEKLEKRDALGKKIRELRQAKEISVRKMAKILNISPTFLSLIENGHSAPPDKLLRDISIALGVNEKSLFDIIDRPPYSFMEAFKIRDELPREEYARIIIECIGVKYINYIFCYIIRKKWEEGLVTDKDVKDIIDILKKFDIEICPYFFICNKKSEEVCTCECFKLSLEM